jgi:hypothetical protein
VLARRIAAVRLEIDELAGQREPSGGPADILRERREQRRRNGQAVSVDHSVARGAKLQAELHTSACLVAAAASSG